ncbi:MAG TPA: DUF5947 family protein [Polyangiaceae bacterium]
MTDTTLLTLRAFAAPRERIERCELCAAPIATEHEHVFDPKAARLRCTCGACARLLPGASGTALRRVDSFARRIFDLELDDAVWEKLGVPVGLAFFSLRGPTFAVVASLPGRAGIVESAIPRELWWDLAEEHAVLRSLVPEVEALLVRRTPGHSDYFHASIDICFRLAGCLRSDDGPLSGPEPALVSDFFAELDAAARGARRSVA